MTLRIAEGLILPEAVAMVIRTQQLQIVDDSHPGGADIQLVGNLLKAPANQKRDAVLFGGRLTQPDFLLDGAASAKYVPAPLCLTLYLHLSPDFRRRRESTAAAIIRAAGQPNSRWQIIDEFADWLGWRRQCQSQCLAIICSSESEPLGMSYSSFEAQVAQRHWKDPSRTSIFAPRS